MTPRQRKAMIEDIKSSLDDDNFNNPDFDMIAYDTLSYWISKLKQDLHVGPSSEHNTNHGLNIMSDMSKVSVESIGYSSYGSGGKAARAFGVFSK